MVREINRLCGTNYTIKDCFNPVMSTIMFVRLQQVTNKEMNPEKAARLWNGAYGWKAKKSTLTYWKKVKEVMNGK